MRVYILKKVENIVANGEIARFDQFLLLSQCFEKSSAAVTSESICMWKRVKRNNLLYLNMYVGKG